MVKLVESYLSIVSFEVANVLKGVGREELDEIGVGSGKHVATIAEGTLPASSYHHLLERSDVVDEKVHQSQLLAKSHQCIQPTWMKSNAIGLLLELLVQLQRAKGGWNK